LTLIQIPGGVNDTVAVHDQNALNTNTNTIAKCKGRMGWCG
jgi:hypothetical protein